jgi:hypothetical protein
MRTDRKLLALQITNLVYALTHTGSSIELRAIAVAHIKHVTGHPNRLLVVWHAVPTGIGVPLLGILEGPEPRYVTAGAFEHVTRR